MTRMRRQHQVIFNIFFVFYNLKVIGSHSIKRLNIVLNNEIQYIPLQSQNQLLLTEKKQLSPEFSQFEEDGIVKPKKLGILEFVSIELTRYFKYLSQ